MYPTMEIRWFYQGQLPPEVAAWFVRLGPPAEEQPGRTDHYLRLPGNEALGIKLREGRLELKRRESQPETADFHPQVSGWLARWRKWSFPLAESDSPLPGPDTAWVAVEKRRRLRRYRVASGREVELVLGETEPAQGCEFELSQIEAAGRQWWSVCFEAFGDEANLERYLRLTARHVFGIAEPPLFALEDSHSYPAWLEEIV